MSNHSLSRQALVIAMVLTSSTAAMAQKMSPADCAAVADRAARDQRSVMGGAARSATRGAIFGAIVGDSGRSAGRGAALGAFVGGTRSAVARNDVYERVYDDCMRGRYR